ELRELRAAEEIANDRAERFRIDELLRRHSVDVDVEQSHGFFHQSLRAGETDAALIGQQFAHCPHATAAEVIDVVERAFSATQINQVFDRSDEIFVGQNPLGKVDIDPELLIDFVTADATEIVFFWIEKQRLKGGARSGGSAPKPREPRSLRRRALRRSELWSRVFLHRASHSASDFRCCKKV